MEIRKGLDRCLNSYENKQEKACGTYPEYENIIKFLTNPREFFHIF